VWRGIKKEEGNNNVQKDGERLFEWKGDIFTIKIMGCIVKGEEWEGNGRGAGQDLSSLPARLHHVDNRYRKSSPNT